MILSRQSITWRITLLFSLVATAVLLALGLMVNASVERHFVAQDLDQLRGKLQLVSHVLAQIDSAEKVAELPSRLQDALVGHRDIALQVSDTHGQTLFSSGDTAFPATHPEHGTDALHHADPEDRRWRRLAADLPTGIPGAEPWHVVVAIDGAHHEQFLASFRRWLWLFVGVAALLTGVLGAWAVRRGLAPLRDMRDEAAGVSANHLDRRLHTDKVPAELAELAHTLNDMLQRLQDDFQRLRDFSSDLAHELRTPVNNLRTGTEVALGRARSVEEYRDVLASNLEEYDRLARMIADMLFLAQADNGRVIPRSEDVDLARQAQDLGEYFEALAADKGLHIEVSGQAHVKGETLMLRRAIANLLENAIRHAPPGGQVSIRVRAIDGAAVVDVENDGEQIPEPHRERLFDRFYRVDPARHRSGEGAGLGLSITRAIARAHRGDVSVRCAAGRVCFSLRLPTG